MNDKLHKVGDVFKSVRGIYLKYTIDMFGEYSPANLQKVLDRLRQTNKEFEYESVGPTAMLSVVKSSVQASRRPPATQIDDVSSHRLALSSI